MPNQATHLSAFAQVHTAADVTVRSKRGTYTVKRRRKGAVSRGAIPRLLTIECTQAQVRDFAARAAALPGATGNTVLVALLLALNADHETGRVDPRWSTQEQLARFHVSVATIRREENRMVRGGILLRERVQLSKRKRIRVLSCNLRKQAVPTTHAARVQGASGGRKSTAHGERSDTAHHERLGVTRTEYPPNPPANPRAVTAADDDTSATAKKSSRVPSWGSAPPSGPPGSAAPQAPSAPNDERGFAASFHPDPGAPSAHDERGFAASLPPDPEDAAQLEDDREASGGNAPRTPRREPTTNPGPIAGASIRPGTSYRAGDAVPRAPRSIPRCPEAFTGPDERSHDTRIASLQRWRECKPHVRSAPPSPSNARAVDRDAFAQLELDAIVSRLAFAVGGC